MTRRTRIALAVAAAIIAAPVVFLGGIFARDTAVEYLAREAFDSAAWQDPDRVKDAARIRMVDDLLGTTNLKSKSRDEIVALLGEPDETSYFRRWDLVYWLGPERGFFSIDSEWLVLRLNEESVVTEYRLARD